MINGIIYHSTPHHKNEHALKQQCLLFNIPLQKIDSIEEIQKSEYNVVIFFSNYYDPSLFPGKAIIYGPHLFIFPHGEIAGPVDEKHSSHSVFNVLSEWNVHVQNEFGGMKAPMKCLPFGVDIYKFKPSTNEKTDIFIYFKRRDPEFFRQVCDYVKNLPYTVHFLVYGQYNEQAYLDILKKSKFGIWIGTHESQGFGLQEALACNVPLIVWNVHSMFDEFHAYDHLSGQKQLKATSHPYWDDRCGMSVKSFDEFVSVFPIFEQKLSTFTPRQFILETLSPKVCMQRLMDVCNKLLSK
jgi:hypothetical protein